MSGTVDLILKSVWVDDGSKTGAIKLTLTGKAGQTLPEGTRLAITLLTRIPPDCELIGATLACRVANYHEFAPLKVLEADASGLLWDITIPTLSHRPTHYTEGPSSAFLIMPDNTIQAVACAPFEKEGEAYQPIVMDTPTLPAESLSDGPMLGLLPMANKVEVAAWCEMVPNGFITGEADPSVDSVNGLYQRLFKSEVVPYRSNGEGLLLTIREADAGLVARGNDAFRLTFSATNITLEASGSGRLYGLIALAQLWQAASRAPHLFMMPAEGVIEDWPTQSWRGTHLDVARQFYEKDTISDFLDVMAWNRLNRFHWHLTDDEGWRLESIAYPTLARVGGFRGHRLPLLPQLGWGAERNGGYYSQQDVKEIIAHAASLAIEVMPELDVPGHCQSALMAVPELLDPSALDGGASVQGYINNALNPGLSATWRFLESVFGEVADLFPGRYVHVGGDEVAEGAWDGSRSALSWARAKGLVGDNGAPDDMKMQANVLQFVANQLDQAGKLTVAWQEAAHGGGLNPDKTILMAWMKPESGPELAAKGYRVVMCPGQAYYLDMAQSPDWNEPGLNWAGTSDLKQSYGFDPLAGFGSADDSVIGLQGCIWSENLLNRGLFNYMVFPRLSAIAESAWTAPDHKDWTSFATRHPLMPTLPAQ